MFISEVLVNAAIWILFPARHTLCPAFPAVTLSRAQGQLRAKVIVSIDEETEAQRSSERLRPALESSQQRHQRRDYKIRALKKPRGLQGAEGHLQSSSFLKRLTKENTPREEKTETVSLDVVTTQLRRKP